MRAIFLVALFSILPTAVFGQNDDEPKSVSEIFEAELNHINKPEIPEQSESVRRRSLEILVKALSLPKKETRVEAETLLLKLVKPTDVAFLIRALKDKAPDEKAQIPIVKALGVAGDPAALDSLKFEYNQGELPLQGAIVEALGSVRDQAVVKYLDQLFRSLATPPELKVKIAGSLGRLGGEMAVYSLSSGVSFSRGSPERIASDWALKVAKGEVPTDKTDEEWNEGIKKTALFRGTEYFYYLPPKPRDGEAKSWLLVCVHGAELNYEVMFDVCQALAKMYKLALVAPFFDPVKYPDYGRFNLQRERSDLWLKDLVAHLSKNGLIKSREFFLFGIGTGGDFVERFVMSYPKMVARAAFYPKEVLDLEENPTFPYGLKRSPLAPDLKFSLDEIVKTDFAMLVSPDDLKNREFRAFFNSLSKYAESREMAGRMVVRPVTGQPVSLPLFWDVAQRFLFPG